MANYPDTLASLAAFRNHIRRRQQTEGTTILPSTAPTPAGVMEAESARIPAVRTWRGRGAYSAYANALTNIHATGMGVRQKGGEYKIDEHVLKLFVFEKIPLPELGIPHESEFKGIPIDVEELPIQVVRGAAAPALLPPQRARFNQIPGGVSISPLGAGFVGTLGCFLERRGVDKIEHFALSNNHVMADVNSLPLGTKIVQPGPEVPPHTTSLSDAFAELSAFINIEFPSGAINPPINQFDAAIATVTKPDRMQVGQMFGIPRYRPDTVVDARPGMRVIKCGRTTGVTQGTITATGLRGVQVNYGTAQFPRVAVFDEIIRIAGDGGRPFSLPGDSGSVILEQETGHPGPSVRR